MRPPGTPDFHQVPHKLQGLLCHMGAVLRIGVAEYPRQTSHRAVHRHGAVGAPHHIFALLAESAFLRAAGHLIPYHASSPDPPGPLQSVGDGGVLPPVDEQADRRSWPAAFRASDSHSAIHLVQLLWSRLSPSKSGRAFLGSCCCTSGWWCGFSPRVSSRPKHRADR